MLSHYNNLVSLISGNTIVRDTFLIPYLEDHLIALWVSNSACFSRQFKSAHNLALVNPSIVIASSCLLHSF